MLELSFYSPVYGIHARARVPMDSRILRAKQVRRLERDLRTTLDQCRIQDLEGVVYSIHHGDDGVLIAVGWRKTTVLGATDD